MHAIYRRRLERLASFLDTLPRKQFDIGTFGTKDDYCGTVACAAGWAGLMPEFRRVGFKLNFENDYWGKISYKPTTKFDNLRQRYSRNEHSDSFTKVADFFGMEYDEVYKLFNQGEHYGHELPTPKRVAKELRKYLRNASKEKVNG